MCDRKQWHARTCKHAHADAHSHLHAHSHAHSHTIAYSPMRTRSASEHTSISACPSPETCDDICFGSRHACLQEAGVSAHLPAYILTGYDTCVMLGRMMNTHTCANHVLHKQACIRFYLHGVHVCAGTGDIHARVYGAHTIADIFCAYCLLCSLNLFP